jgi:hypothetical protein
LSFSNPLLDNFFQHGNCQGAVSDDNVVECPDVEISAQRVFCLLA